MTRKQAHAIAKQRRMRIRWNRDWEEYTVSYRDRNRPTVYHTQDLDDAVDTAIAMSKETT